MMVVVCVCVGEKLFTDHYFQALKLSRIKKNRRALEQPALNVHGKHSDLT